MSSQKIGKGIQILKTLGLPRAQQNERSALTLLALVNVRRRGRWAGAEQRIIRIHDILVFIEKEYGRRYAENTRETIRRQTLHQLEQAGVVERNPDDPSRPTNSPNNVYQIAPVAFEAVKAFGSAKWQRAVETFVREKGSLVEKYNRRKYDHAISLKVTESKKITLSPGKHNELQVRIVKEFRPRFCPDAEVLYVGDTARKLLHIDMNTLKAVSIPITEHDKLPDVVLFNRKKKQLLLIEAVTSHGPMSPKRQVELEQVLKTCKAKRIYVSAFPDFREFKRHIGNIAWDTEVWIADNPDHMVHFNGPKFFTAYGS